MRRGHEGRMALKPPFDFSTHCQKDYFVREAWATKVPISWLRAFWESSAGIFPEQQMHLKLKWAKISLNLHQNSAFDLIRTGTYLKCKVWGGSSGSTDQIYNDPMGDAAAGDLKGTSFLSQKGSWSREGAYMKYWNIHRVLKQVEWLAGWLASLL